MARYQHPVRGVDLLQTAEMRLVHPAERQPTASTSVYDEGAGCGFDNGSADAYAERWVEVDAGAAGVLRWFTERLVGLGWTPSEAIPSSGVAYMRFLRDADERFGVLLQGTGDWAAQADRAVKWDAGLNSMRVHLAVDGTFPGSGSFHVG